MLRSCKSKVADTFCLFLASNYQLSIIYLFDISKYRSIRTSNPILTDPHPLSEVQSIEFCESKEVQAKYN